MIEQRTPEWFARRCGKVTGYGVCKIMATKRNGESGADRITYMVQLLAERMTGSVSVNFVGKPAERGVEKEPEAIAAYERKTGLFVTEGYWIDAGFWGCTPDAFVEDDGILSVKCPNTTTVVRQRFFDTEIPQDYYWQAVAEMVATGRKWVDLLVYDDRFIKEEDHVWVRRIDRDPEVVKHTLSEIRRFADELDTLTEQAGITLSENYGRMLWNEPPEADLVRYLRA